MGETLSKWGPVLGAIGGIVSAIMGAGPVGMIAAAVAGVALLVGGILLYNKIKAWNYAKAQKESEANAIKDEAGTIGKNQSQGKADSAAVDDYEKAKAEAKKKG